VPLQQVGGAPQQVSENLAFVANPMLQLSSTQQARSSSPTGRRIGSLKRAKRGPLGRAPGMTLRNFGGGSAASLATPPSPAAAQPGSPTSRSPFVHSRHKLESPIAASNSGVEGGAIDAPGSAFTFTLSPLQRLALSRASAASPLSAKRSVGALPHTMFHTKEERSEPNQ
jgi:hypothetical protein